MMTRVLIAVAVLLVPGLGFAQSKCDPHKTTLRILHSDLDAIQSRAQRYLDFVQFLTRNEADSAFGTASLASKMVIGPSAEEVAWTLAVFLELSGTDDVAAITPQFVDFVVANADDLVEQTRQLTDVSTVDSQLAAQTVVFRQTDDMVIQLVGSSPATGSAVFTMSTDDAQQIPPGLYEIRFRDEKTGLCAVDRHIIDQRPREFLVWPDRTGYQTSIGRLLEWKPCTP